MRPGFGVVPDAASACQVGRLVNSCSATPIFRSTHSIGSYDPVEMAVNGMSPSADVEGKFRSCGSAFCAHAVVIGKWYRRRQRPSWITTGMVSDAFLLTGTFSSVNLPLKPVAAVSTG